MAKGKLVFRDAEEVKKAAEAEALAIEESSGDSFDKIALEISQAMEVSKVAPKGIDVKETSFVLLFYKMVIEVLGGKNIKVSYKLPKDYAGEAACVEIVGKNIEFKDLTPLFKFKGKIGAVEITDHTNGTISVCFSFFNTIKGI